MLVIYLKSTYSETIKQIRVEYFTKYSILESLLFKMLNYVGLPPKRCVE